MDRSEYNRHYYLRKKPYILAKLHERRNSDREAFKQQCREYRANNLERMREKDRLYYNEKKHIILPRKREVAKLRQRVTYWRQKVKEADTPANRQRLERHEQVLAEYLERRDVGEL